MSKIIKIEKSRKEVTCSKCNKTLPVGSAYLKSTPYKRSTIIRCVECGLQSWETSSSEYTQFTGELCNNWQNTYGIGEESLEDLKGDIEEFMDGLQEKLDNLPEQFQYAGPGEIIQEHLDSLDSCLSELSDIDISQIEDDLEEEIKEELNRKDYESDEEFEAAVKELRDERAEEQFTQLVDDALCNL